MPLNLFPPVLYQGVPFGDSDALTDWEGHHELEHRALAAATNTPYLPMGDLRVSGNLEPHNRMHQAVALAAGIAAAYDLLSYDLRERASYQGFMVLHGNDHQRLRQALRL